ncbi:MAG: hypothetical protein JSS58_02065 [Proteobacteria bacterium]|nr:hypothetical protein [Pseudomonadota bacterium]
MATQNPASAGKPGTTPAKDAPQQRSFKRDDFPYIRKASIILAACLAISILTVSGSTYFLANQKKAKDAEQALNTQTNEKTTEAEHQKRDIHDFQPKYVQLVKRGFVGEERRLEWVESIKKIQETRKLLPIDYEISPQQSFQLDPAMPLQLGDLELHGSKMHITIQLLHEMDLLNFFRDLKTMQIYALNNCAITPPSAPTNDALSPSLTAECSLYWITVGKNAAASSEPDKPAEQ